MKFSYNWIHELVDSLDVPAEEIGRLITLKTAECEGVEAHGAMLDQVCVARVLTAEKVEGTHLTLTTVDTGRYGVKQVICGAPNCRAGVITAYAPIGKKVIHGVESDGMLASGAELGLNRDHTGILEFDAQVGAQQRPVALLDDVAEREGRSRLRARNRRS